MAYGTLTVAVTPQAGIVGQAVRLTLTVKDASATAVDPATLTVTITGGGSSSTVAIGQLTHVSTGSYTYDFLATASAVYTVSAVSTVPEASGQTSFTIDDATLPGRLLGSGHLTVSEFRAMPTRLAVDSLVVGQIHKAENSELADVLARASAWADSYCVLPVLGQMQTSVAATAGTVLAKVRTDRDGDIHYAVGVHPKIPVTVSSLAYGGTRTTLTTMTDLTSVLVTQGMLVAQIAGGLTAWTGALQFGAPLPGTDLWMQAGLVVGWPNSQLTTAVTAGADTAILSNTTGITAGTVLTVTDPGSEETVTVLSVAANTITIVGTFASAHDVGAGFTAIPADIREAVAYAACARIVTPGVESNPLPGAAVRGGKTQQAQDSTYVGQATALLAPYRRMVP